jgi:cell division cycle protein 37
LLIARWKQRDIHEKREQRKLLIQKLNSELSLNSVLRPRIQSVLDGTRSKGTDHFRAVQRRMREQPSPEKPATGAVNQPTYDMMISQLLGDVFRESAYIVDGATSGSEVKYQGKKVDESTSLPSWAEGVVPDNKAEPLKNALEERLEWHLKELDRRDVEVRKEIEVEEKEQAKKITSEGIKDGWDASSVVKPTASPLEDKPKSKAKKAEKTETIEVLNPGASVSGTKCQHRRLLTPSHQARHHR